MTSMSWTFVNRVRSDRVLASFHVSLVSSRQSSRTLPDQALQQLQHLVIWFTSASLIAATLLEAYLFRVREVRVPITASVTGSES